MTSQNPSPPQYQVGSLSGQPILGCLNEIRDDSLAFFNRAKKEGDLVKFRMAHRTAYGVHHPDLVKEVLMTKHEHFVKKGVYSRLRPVFRDGLVTSMGELWKKQRRTIQPVFTKRNLHYTFNGVEKVCLNYRDQLLEKAKRGETVDVFKEMLYLTLDIMGATMFGDDVSHRREEISEHIYFLNTFMKDSAYAILPPMTWLPTEKNRRYQKAMRTLDGITSELVQKRRKANDFGTDFLGMLLSSTDPETGLHMSDRQVRDEALAFFIAGHETTAAGLSWTYYLLNAHRDVRTHLEDSIDSTLAGRECLALEDLRDFKSAENIFLESMRHYPPIYVTYREADRDTNIGGISIRKGETLYISPYVLNRDERFWTKPNEFRPERFSDAEEGSNKYVFLPFGVGPRSCIGSHFAMMEAQMVLSIIGKAIRFEADDLPTPIPEPLVTLKPQEPLWMKVIAR